MQETTIKLIPLCAIIAIPSKTAKNPMAVERQSVSKFVTNHVYALLHNHGWLMKNRQCLRSGGLASAANIQQAMDVQSTRWDNTNIP
jgi:hypothetical protein